MCRVNIPSGYTLANVCNGILCFASAAGLDDAPPLVCNPVTGEYLTLPSPAPPLGARSIHLLTALGFSPSTREYKLFRLSVVSARHGYPYYPSASQALFPVVPSPATSCCYLDVCTLGGGGNNDGWRHHPYLFLYRRTTTAKYSPPILVDGKLYVLTTNQQQERPDWILVIDVASEAGHGAGEHLRAARAAVPRRQHRALVPSRDQVLALVVVVEGRLGSVLQLLRG